MLPPLMTLYAGAALERFPGGKYFGGLRFFEYVPRPPLPRGATLTRFFHAMPETAVPALRLPQAALVSKAGPLRSDPAQAEALSWALDAAERLQVRAVVLPTPASLTPGNRSRELLRRFVDSLPQPEGRLYVWAPRGVWEEEDCNRLAETLGLVRAFDPLHEERPTGPIAYARLQALGAQTSFSDATLMDVVDKLSGPEVDTAFLSIQSDQSVQQAQRALSLAADLT